MRSPGLGVYAFCFPGFGVVVFESTRIGDAETSESMVDPDPRFSASS
jgi:hypothetical protein